MRELFLVRDNLANKISYYHLLLLMASLPFDRFYSHLILISFGIHTLIQFNKHQIKPVFTRRTLLLQSVFWVTVASTIYTSYTTEAFNEWGKQVTILIFPLLFCFTGLDIKKYRSSLLLGFSLVCTATTAWLFWDVYITIRYYNLPLSWFFSPAFTNHNFSQPIDMHATFFSMQLGIALVYLISILIKEHPVYYKIFYAICICILSAGLLQLCAKSVCFCLLFIVNLGVPYFLLNNNRRWKFMMVSFSVSALLAFGIFNSKTFKQRYVTDLQNDLSAPKAAEAVEPRLARWYVAGELISHSPIVGYGAGSEIDNLHQLFYKKKYYSSFLNNLNVHDEYLSFMLKSGIIGLLVYLITLTYGVRMSFKNKDLLFFTFMLLILFVSFSENILDVDKGTFFYSLFFAFFVYSADEKNDRNDFVNTRNNEPLEHNYLETWATN